MQLQTLIISAALLLPGGAGHSADLLIRGATVIDGTGAPPLLASVRVRGNRISAVGNLTATADDRIVEGAGLILAPGFIDTHSHYDIGIERSAGALQAVSQGITTIVRGQDGHSHDSMRTYTPLQDYIGALETDPVAVNIASLAPHNSIRYHVLGDAYTRPSTQAEIDEMSALLAAEMDAGALGLSTGLEYDPGIYAQTEEIASLAKVAARMGGRYVSHIRSEDRNFWEAIDEIVKIGREAQIPVHISHIKLGAKSLWGQTDRLLARLNDARASGVDISADIYPYEYWRATITVLFPDRNFTDRRAAQFVLDNLVPADDMILAHFEAEPEIEKKTIAEIAVLWKKDTAATLMEIASRADALNRLSQRETDYVIAKGMQEQDIAAIMAWPHTNICSDGYLASDHPRGSGSFPRVLSRYAGDGKTLSLVEAIQKMTSLSAQHMGIDERGKIVAGAYADLVLFDPHEIRDRATYEEPALLSVGIARVWVNGTEVYSNGKTTGAAPGKIVRR